MSLWCRDLFWLVMNLQSILWVCFVFCYFLWTKHSTTVVFVCRTCAACSKIISEIQIVVDARLQPVRSQHVVVHFSIACGWRLFLVWISSRNDLQALWIWQLQHKARVGHQVSLVGRYDSRHHWLYGWQRFHQTSSKTLRKTNKNVSKFISF